MTEPRDTTTDDTEPGEGVPTTDTETVEDAPADTEIEGVATPGPEGQPE